MNEGAQRDVAYRAALLYNAGPNLRTTIAGFMSEEGRRMVGERALKLTSPTIFFDNIHELREAKGNKIDRLVRPNAPLSRVDLMIRVGVEKRSTNRGEVDQLFFQPVDAAEKALQDVGAVALRRTQNILTGAHLSMTVPRRFLPDDEPDVLANDLSDAMRDARRTHGALFATYERTAEDTVR